MSIQLHFSTWNEMILIGQIKSKTSHISSLIVLEEGWAITVVLLNTANQKSHMETPFAQIWSTLGSIIKR